MLGTLSRRAILYALLAICISCSQVVAAPLQNQQSSPSQSSSPNSATPSSQSGSSQSGSSAADKSAAKPADKDKKDSKDPDDQPQSRVKISVVAADTNKPIGNASVYIRYPEGHTLFTHKEKEAEMNFKTNQDGTVKVPEVPRGKTLIQVVAPGWHTYGKYYDIEKEEEEIQIKLDRPPKWY
jgi:hypothetical protein